MRRVIQRTITTTKIVSLTITHSEREEAVEYAVIDKATQPTDPAPAPHQAADRGEIEPPDISTTGPESPEED